MSWLEVFGIALALSVDAFVCSIISGKRRLTAQARLMTAITVAFAFGLFQFLMPLIGFFAGVVIQKYFAAYDHWVAFILLAGVGLNMLKEAFTGEEEEGEHMCACKNDQAHPKQKLIQIGHALKLQHKIRNSLFLQGCLDHRRLAGRQRTHRIRAIGERNQRGFPGL